MVERQVSSSRSVVRVGSIHRTVPPLSSAGMERPSRFEHQRFLGDKRTQVVYDLETWDDRATIEELMEAETYLCFGPDTLPEARNRGYRLARAGRHPRRRRPR
jgi:hypothetical protein